MSLLESAVETLQLATEHNLDDPARQGSWLCFGDYGQVVMTGDLHGHRGNFEKLVRYCQLESTPIRHVLLHELIHEEPASLGAVDRSFELMLDAARWKTFFPDQVHFLQSNHELAQIQEHQITKGGRDVTLDFERGVAEILGTPRIEPALKAIQTFIASFPIAARSPNGVFFAHSLPDAHRLPEFDANCVRQAAEDLDLSEGGSVYHLVWGRRHTPELLDLLSRVYNVKFFLIGHQPQEEGHSVLHDRLIILASDHNHGVFLPVDCRRPYTIEELISRIRPFAGVE